MPKVDVDHDVLESLDFLARKDKCSVSETIAYCLRECFDYRWDVESLRQWYKDNGKLRNNGHDASDRPFLKRVWQKNRSGVLYP